MDEPGTKSGLGYEVVNKKGKSIWKESNFFAMDVKGSEDIPADTVKEVVMDDETEQVKAEKRGNVLPLGRYGLLTLPMWPTCQTTSTQPIAPLT